MARAASARRGRRTTLMTRDSNLPPPPIGAHCADSERCRPIALRVRRRVPGAVRPCDRGVRTRCDARIRRVRRPRLRDGKPRRAPGPHVVGRQVGLQRPARRQLSPAHLALAHGRRDDVRPGAGRAPPHERRPACPQCGAAFSRTADHDGHAVARRRGGGPVRVSSAARRIGGLGRGTKGRAQRPVLDAHDARLRLVRAARWRASIRGRVRGPGAKADVQTDGRDAAVRSAAAGRVASGAMEVSAGHIE